MSVQVVLQSFHRHENSVGHWPLQTMPTKSSSFELAPQGATTL